MIPITTMMKNLLLILLLVASTSFSCSKRAPDKQEQLSFEVVIFSILEGKQIGSLQGTLLVGGDDEVVSGELSLTFDGWDEPKVAIIQGQIAESIRDKIIRIIREQPAGYYVDSNFLDGYVHACRFEDSTGDVRFYCQNGAPKLYQDLVVLVLNEFELPQLHSSFVFFAERDQTYLQRFESFDAYLRTDPEEILVR